MSETILIGDCLDLMRSMETDSVDLVITSPPYEDARQYGIDFRLKGDDWVDWAFERYMECVRVSRGLVAWVVEGKTKNFRYSATPILLMARLHGAGVHLRKPPAYTRVGISGSGGSDWLRNDWEFIVCGTKGGRLPWSDNTAMGAPWKYPKGGDYSHRKSDGTRVKRARKPGIANPGNIIRCHGGKGHFGSVLAHENEAPFPEKLAEFFIRSFCPPDGIVLDPFVGSGTSLAVAKRFGRRGIGMDVRQSQEDLTRRRLAEVS